MKTQDHLDHQAMPPTKIQVFFKEFPWIKKFVDGPVNQVYVFLMKREMLHYSPSVYEGDFSTPTNERLYITNENGELITFVAKRIENRKKYIFFGPMITELVTINFVGRISNRSTLWKTMQESGKIIDEVRYLVSYCPCKKAVILYKLPKGALLSQWAIDEVDTASIEIKKTLAEIDSVEA